MIRAHGMKRALIVSARSSEGRLTAPAIALIADQPTLRGVSRNSCNRRKHQATRLRTVGAHTATGPNEYRPSVICRRPVRAPKTENVATGSVDSRLKTTIVIMAVLRSSCHIDAPSLPCQGRLDDVGARSQREGSDGRVGGTPHRHRLPSAAMLAVRFGHALDAARLDAVVLHPADPSPETSKWTMLVQRDDIVNARVAVAFDGLDLCPEVMLLQVV